MANNFEFIPGITTGARLIAQSLFGQYKDYFDSIDSMFYLDLNIKEAKGEIVKKLYGGVMIEHHAAVSLGRIDNYLAMQVTREDKVRELILAPLSSADMQKYNVIPGGNRDCLVFALHGVGYRKRLMQAAQNTDWRTMQAGTYAIAISKSLEQVNNMPDMAEQIRMADAHEEDDSWNTGVVFVEGITECDDETIINYNYMHCKPDGHNGGGETFADEDGEYDTYMYEYSLRMQCVESVTYVHLMRGKTKAIFIDAEGHSYSKYLLLPCGYREMYKEFLEQKEEE